MIMPILTVCTGNICRSPVAQAALATALESSGIIVSSAGTHAATGFPATEETIVFVRRTLGVDLDHRARPLTRATITGADLVLTMTVEQRIRVATEEPRAVRRVFTLRELARIVHELPPTDRFGDLRSFAHGCGRLRSRRNGDPGDLDIVDPFGGPPEGYAASFDEILTAATDIASAINSRVGHGHSGPSHGATGTGGGEQP